MAAGRVKGDEPRAVLRRRGVAVLAVAAASTVIATAGLTLGVFGRGLELRDVDLLWVVPSWVVWFAVDVALGRRVGHRGARLAGLSVREVRYRAAGNAAVLALAPLVVVGQHVSLWFLLVLLVPLIALHRTAQLSVQEQHRARHDALTGLPNRELLLETLDAAVAAVEPFAVALLDLDRFKEVNDTLGHHVGDQLLQVVAARITAATRPGDVVARLGGDEFAVYLPRVASAETAVDEAARLCEALAEPVHLEGVLLEIEASIGVALCPAHGEDVDQLVRHADVAMYRAKRQQSAVEVYDAHQDTHSAHRLGLLAALRRALDGGELELYYQPKVALDGQEAVGVEALLRWNLPGRGVVLPDEFVPLAERSGLVHRLTAFVVDEAVAQVARWREDGLELQVAVNVSARDLDGPHLARTVAEALARHRVPARLLQLELTERMLMAEHAQVVDTLVALEALDVRISLDDFGTGYSSMFMLRRIHVDEIKVDRSFVSRLADTDDDTSIVRSIIELAHALGVRAVAEGVETEAVWRELQRLGCDSAQGFFIGRPMDADGTTGWLRAHIDPRRAAAALRLA